MSAPLADRNWRVLPAMDEALEYIRRELRLRLGLEDHEVLLESARVLSDRSDTRGVAISLVNVGVSPYQGSGLSRPGWLDLMELVLLLSFRFSDYRTSLKHLSTTMRLLHERPSYTASDSHAENPFPPGLQSLLFTLHPLEFDALNDLWGMLGGNHAPSVVYNLRMVQTKN